MVRPLTCECGARFEQEEIFPGQKILCSQCGQDIRIPPEFISQPPASFFAITSLILAIAGFPTLIGSLAAIVLGIIALLEIRRHRSLLRGTGLALGGILLGILGILATSAVVFGGVPVPFASHLLVNQKLPDETGSLDYVDTANKFSLSRPDHQWGIIFNKSLQEKDPSTRQPDPVVGILLSPSHVLLMAHRDKRVYIDVSVDFNQFRSLDEVESLVLEEFTFGNAMNNPFNKVNIQPNMDQNQFFIRSVVSTTSRVDFPPVDGISGREWSFTTRFAMRNWPFRIRIYKKGDHLHIVRAYARSQKEMDAVKPDVDRILDSFRILK